MNKHFDTVVAIQSAEGYRRDIDGLRAIAVLAVVLYHYGAAWLPGGFAGVDVFFVISGYLITKSIVDDIAVNGTALPALLVRFYNRRIRRIVPALTVVLVATLVAGWFILMPGDYAATGESAAYSAIGAGNWYFYQNTGYFDQSADLLPLKNMWSLGVEEQFYLLWPVLLVGATWLAKGRTWIIIGMVVSLIAASFLWGLSSAATDPKGAFYLPLPRAWELGAGAFLVFLPPLSGRLFTEMAGAVGLTLIGWSIFTLPADELSLGWSMLPAVLGSALLVWPRSESWTARALSLSPVRFVGRISYGLYLWHWPVLVYFRHYANGAMPEPAEAAALLGVTLCVSYLSWRFVEQPIRRARVVPWQMIGGGLGAVSVVTAAGSIVVLAGGFLARIPASALTMSSLEDMWAWECPLPSEETGFPGGVCVAGAGWSQAEHKALVWGDSHAQALMPTVAASVSGTSMSALLPAQNMCPAILDNRLVLRNRNDVPNYTEQCAEKRAGTLAWLSTHRDVDLVILTASWPNLSRVIHGPDGAKSAEIGVDLIKVGLREVIRAASIPGRRFILVADVPQWPHDPAPCAATIASRLLRADCSDQLKLSRDYFLKTQGAAQDAFEEIAAEFDNVISVYPGRALCAHNPCTTSFNGEFIYRDAGHLRRNLSNQTHAELSELFGLPAALAN